MKVDRLHVARSIYVYICVYMHAANVGSKAQWPQDMKYVNGSCSSSIFGDSLPIPYFKKRSTHSTDQAILNMESEEDPAYELRLKDYEPSGPFLAELV